MTVWYKKLGEYNDVLGVRSWVDDISSSLRTSARRKKNTTYLSLSFCSDALSSTSLRNCFLNSVISLFLVATEALSTLESNLSERSLESNVELVERATTTRWLGNPLILPEIRCKVRWSIACVCVCVLVYVLRNLKFGAKIIKLNSSKGWGEATHFGFMYRLRTLYDTYIYDTYISIS